LRSLQLLGLAIAAAVLAPRLEANTQGSSLGFPLRRGIAFDPTGHYLLIAQSDGFVEKLSLGPVGPAPYSYRLGVPLNALDSSTNGSFFLVAQNEPSGAQGIFHKVDTSTEKDTSIAYLRAIGEAGAWNVAIASNNLAFVTTQGDASASVPLRQIDLSSNAITNRADAPGSGPGGTVAASTEIYRSADRTRLYFLESNSSSGSVFTYNAVTNTFGPKVNRNTSLQTADGAVSRDGSLVGTCFADGGLWLETAPDFKLVHKFDDIDHGVAFDAVRDIVYGASSVTDEIIGYSTTNFTEVFRAKIGEDVAPGRTPGIISLIASPDGRFLAATTKSGVRLIPTVPSGTANLTNISTRGIVQTGNNVLIGGFIIVGPDAKEVVIRGMGPSLVHSGITNPLQDPVVDLYDGRTNALIHTNDNWRDDFHHDSDLPFTLQPEDARESAFQATLQPGPYTVVLRGKDGGTGVGLFEVYELSPIDRSRLANISTRGFVQTGDDVLIAGVTVQGGDYISEVVVRAIGPSLSAFGITNALANPILELHDANGTVLNSNDNWKDTNQAAIEATGLAPTNDLESAIRVTVAAGSFTAIVRGADNGTGVAVVEIYDLN
jgi:hypothetical protein